MFLLRLWFVIQLVFCRFICNGFTDRLTGAEIKHFSPVSLRLPKFISLRGLKMTVENNDMQHDQSIQPREVLTPLIKESEALSSNSLSDFKSNDSILQQEWDIVLDSLITYESKFGHLRIDKDFIIPTDDISWPELTRGLKLGVKAFAISLGKYVNGHPDRKNKLDRLGFNFIPPKTPHMRLEIDGILKACEALSIYKYTVSEFLFLSSSYRVPSVEPWPPHLHRLPLGNICKNIRLQRDLLQELYPQVVERLDELGFDWVEGSSAEKQFNRTLVALTEYKLRFGNVAVPKTFIVPNTSDWHPNSRRLRLGEKVHGMRLLGTYVLRKPEYREALTRLDFNWSLPSLPMTEKETLLKLTVTKDVPLDKSRFEMEAEETKHIEELRVKVQHPFREQIQKIHDREWIPGEPSSRDSVHGYDILNEGMSHEAQEYKWKSDMEDFLIKLRDPYLPIVTHYTAFPIIDMEEVGIQQSAPMPYEAIEQMKRMKHRMLEFDKFDWRAVIDALKLYKSLFGHVNVPLDFYVDEEILELNIGFTMAHYGMQLGHFVQNIREGEVDALQDPERNAELAALGFQWGDLKSHLRIRFTPMYAALVCFQANMDHTWVPHDFVIPDSLEWGYWMVHMPLGEWCQVCRFEQDMLRHYHPEKVIALNDVKFPWNPGHETPPLEKYTKPLLEYVK